MVEVNRDVKRLIWIGMTSPLLYVCRIPVVRHFISGEE